MNVIFDLGKVLIDYDFEIFFRAVGCAADIRTLAEAERPLMQFDAGKLSRNVFYLSMQDIYNFKVDQATFEKAWRRVFTPIPQMLELARQIGQEHEVFILSNTDEIHFPYIWNNFLQLHHFGDNLMLSYELQAVKPDFEIYQFAMNKFNLKPEECIFIDDKIINVEAAENYGIPAIWHQSFQITKNKLSKFLTKKY